MMDASADFAGALVAGVDGEGAHGKGAETLSQPGVLTREDDLLIEAAASANLPYERRHLDGFGTSPDHRSNERPPSSHAARLATRRRDLSGRWSSRRPRKRRDRTVAPAKRRRFRPVPCGPASAGSSPWLPWDWPLDAGPGRSPCPAPWCPAERVE